MQDSFKQKRPTQGFTVVEFLMVSVVLAILMVGIGTALQGSHIAYAESTATAQVDESMRRIMERLTERLRYAEPDTLNPLVPIDSPSLRFATVTGWNGTEENIGATETIAFTNGQVLIDGQVIAEGVQNLEFDLVGRILSVTLEIQRPVTVANSTLTISRTLVTRLSL